MGWAKVGVEMTSIPPATGSLGRLADGVLVINLDHRPERLERFAAMAEGHPQLAGWERVAAVNGVDLPGYGAAPWFRGGKRDKCWAGRAGCTLSHRNAIARAKAAGWRSVLILEDDALPGPEFSADVEDFIRSGGGKTPPWEVCYLGWSQQAGPAHEWAALPHGRSLCRVDGCFGTFAYQVKQEAYDWILARLPTVDTVWPWIARYRAVDRWYARNLSRRFRCCALSPSLIGHYESFSDIGQRGGATISSSSGDGEVSAELKCRGTAGFGLGLRLRRLGLAIAGQANIIRAAGKRFRGL